MKTINEIIGGLPSKKFIEIIFFGIISGLPFSILYTALIVWLTDSGHILSTVTTIAIARTPYAFKYIWAPFIDRVKIPFLYKIGRRKSWMMLTSFVSSFILILFSLTNPISGFNFIYILAIILGFSSASFDIAFDAYRIDSVSPEKQGYAVSCAILGYRLGMIVVSSGSLTLAHFYGWSIAFVILASIFILAILYMPFVDEQIGEEKENLSLSEKIQESVINPFLEFFSRKNSSIILCAIILYKVGDVLLGFVSTPFYLELGYTKLQIGSVVKFFGFWATLAGTMLGAYIIGKVGNLKGLVICGVIQAFVNSIFIWLHYSPVEWNSLLIAITVENIGAGAGTVALTAYLSALCNRAYSATQYALLSSFAVLMNSTISIKAGTMVELIGWDYFFLATVILSFPALVLFIYLDKKDLNYNRPLE